MFRRVPEYREAQREHVRATAQRAWGEPVRVFHLDTADIRYRVRGRRRDGIRKAPKEDRDGCLGVAVAVVADFGPAVAELVMIGLGRLFLGPMRDFVWGQENSGAVRFADAFRRGADWLVWSPSRTGLVRLYGDGKQELVWSAVGAERPELRLPRRLRWVDGSRVRLSALQLDREALRRELGRSG